jgi:hypothetical protein
VRPDRDMAGRPPGPRDVDASASHQVDPGDARDTLAADALGLIRPKEVAQSRAQELGPVPLRGELGRRREEVSKRRRIAPNEPVQDQPVGRDGYDSRGRQSEWYRSREFVHADAGASAIARTR